MPEVALKVAMMCEGCSGAVQRVLGKMPGVQNFNIDMPQQKVTVTVDDTIDPAALSPQTRDIIAPVLAMSSPAAVPPPAAPIGAPSGSQAAEIAIFASCMVIFFVYHIYYFERHRLLHSCFRGNKGEHRDLSGANKIDLWTAAIESRVIWAREMIRQPKSDDNLLAMHTMRNVIIASTLAITGLGQVLGRLFVIITDQSSLNQIDKYTSSDPIGANSFTSPETKVGLATAILLISFGAFAQCARLSVHLSFIFRVASCTEGKQLGQALRAESIAMTHRVSVYFTVGIRLIFLFMILISWCMGITVMLIFFVVVILLMAWSDYMPTNVSSRQLEKTNAATDRLLESKATSTSGGNSPNTINREANETNEIRASRRATSSNGNSATYLDTVV